MHKSLTGLFFFTLLLTACNNQSKPYLANDTASLATQNDTVRKEETTTAVADAFLIVAGEQIGQVHIADSAAKPLRLLGRPDGGDAAMGSATLTWMGKGNPPSQLDVYTHYRDSSMTDRSVKQIRTTSPAFSTTDGLRVGLMLSEATQRQPGLKFSSSESVRKGIRFYDDKANCLAIEADSNANGQKVVSVIVHEKGQGVRSVYQ